MFITATCKDMKIDELTWVRRVSMEEKKKSCSTSLFLWKLSHHSSFYSYNFPSINLLLISPILPSWLWYPCLRNLPLLYSSYHILPETVGSSLCFLSTAGLKVPLKNSLPHPFLCLAQCLAQSMCSVRLKWDNARESALHKNYSATNYK